MANLFSLHLLLVALNTATLRPVSSAAHSSPPVFPPVFPPTIPPPSYSPPIIRPPPLLPRPSSPSQSHSSPPSIPPPPRPSSPITTEPPPLLPGRDELQEQLLKNIINALIGAGDFRGWASLLSAADPSTLPPTATLFIPGDDALSHFPTVNPTAAISFDPFIIPYHILPLRLRFSDLQLFKTHSRLPTLLPSNSILITNNSRFNFTIDGSPITHPDLYINSAISVHGIKTILDYSIYGSGFFPPPAPITFPETVAPPHFPSGLSDRRSDVACLCTEFPIIFLAVCAGFAFKIHGNPLTR